MAELFRISNEYQNIESDDKLHFLSLLEDWIRKERTKIKLVDASKKPVLRLVQGDKDVR